MLCMLTRDKRGGCSCWSGSRHRRVCRSVTGSTDDAVCVGIPQRDGGAHLSVRSQTARHSVPDAQERPQADDDDGRCQQPCCSGSSSRRSRRPHQVASKQGVVMHRRRRQRQVGRHRPGRPHRPVRLAEKIQRQRTTWLFLIIYASVEF